MKNNYFKLYVCSSIITFLVNIIFLLLQFKSGKVPGVMYDFLELYKGYPLVIIMIVLGFALFVLNVNFKRNKYELDKTNNLMIYGYMCFFSLMLIIALLFNCKVIMKNIQLIYYYGFIVFDYLLLSVYTLLSFKLDNKKKK